MYTMLKEKTKGIKDEILSFASKLIKEQSHSLDEQRVSTIVKAEMEKVGFDEVHRDDAGNIIGIMYGRSYSPSILFSSHMDTVGLSEDEKWQEKPYGAEIKDGRLYGRGASDCKAGIAAQIYGALLLKRSFLPLNGNLVVAATSAEENGLGVGARHMMNDTLPKLGIKPEIVILGEPTSLDLYYGHEGWMEVDVKVQGCDSFSVSDAASIIVNEIKEEFVENENSKFQIYDVKKEGLNNGEQMTVRYRRRINRNDNYQSVLGNLKKRLSSATKFAGAVELSASMHTEEQTLYTGKTMTTKFINSAWESDPFSPEIKRVRQSLAAAGEKPVMSKWKLGRLDLGTAGGVFANEFNMPVIGYGPGSEKLAHAKDEYVECNNLMRAAYGNASIAHGVAGIPVFGWTLDEI